MIGDSQDKLSLLASMALKTEAKHTKVGASSVKGMVGTGYSPCRPALSCRKELHRGPPKEIVFFRHGANDGDESVASKKREHVNESNITSSASSSPTSLQQSKKRRIGGEKLPSLIPDDDDDGDSLDSGRLFTTLEQPPMKLAKGVYFNKPTNTKVMMARKYTAAGSFTSNCVPLVHPALLAQGVAVAAGANTNIKPLSLQAVSYIDGVAQS